MLTAVWNRLYLIMIVAMMSLLWNEAKLPLQKLSLQLLAPFGEGFEEPLFLLEKQKVQDCRSLSKGAHTKWILSDDLEAMQFQSRDWEFWQLRSDPEFYRKFTYKFFHGTKKSKYLRLQGILADAIYKRVCYNKRNVLGGFT